MKLKPSECWGLIPARGGSRSVPLKNLADLGGRPLLDYCAAAGLAAERVSRTICSTDVGEIAKLCKTLGVEVHHRPTELSRDDTPVLDVIVHFLNDIATREGEVAEWIALLQPTSPFILPEHIDQCIDALRSDSKAGSAQTVIPCPHHHHAFNQRVVTDGRVSFRFPEERNTAYNKQKKPALALFGNVVVFRTEYALEQNAVFAEPSLAVEVPPLFGFDCDGPIDFEVGKALLAANLIGLPHLPRP